MIWVACLGCLKGKGNFMSCLVLIDAEMHKTIAFDPLSKTYPGTQRSEWLKKEFS
jgi:hypothetical protein